jgi:hypothetical protein
MEASIKTSLAVNHTKSKHQNLSNSNGPLFGQSQRGQVFLYLTVHGKDIDVDFIQMRI